MTTTTKKSNNSTPIFVDDIISDMLRYLGNLSDFFQVMMEKNTDALPDVYTRIAPELEQQHKRLTNYQRLRKGQVKVKIELRISEHDGKFINALSGHEWFQKSYWGRSVGLRTVSRDEAIENAIEAIMFGVVYIHHIIVGIPRGFRSWMSRFHTSILIYLTEFIESQ